MIGIALADLAAQEPLVPADAAEPLLFAVAGMAWAGRYPALLRALADLQTEAGPQERLARAHAELALAADLDEEAARSLAWSLRLRSELFQTKTPAEWARNLLTSVSLAESAYSPPSPETPEWENRRVAELRQLKALVKGFRGEWSEASDLAVSAFGVVDALPSDSEENLFAKVSIATTASNTFAARGDRYLNRAAAYSRQAYAAAGTLVEQFGGRYTPVKTLARFNHRANHRAALSRRTSLNAEALTILKQLSHDAPSTRLPVLVASIPLRDPRALRWLLEEAGHDLQRTGFVSPRVLLLSYSSTIRANPGAAAMFESLAALQRSSGAMGPLYSRVLNSRGDSPQAHHEFTKRLEMEALSIAEKLRSLTPAITRQLAASAGGDETQTDAARSLARTVEMISEGGGQPNESGEGPSALVSQVQATVALLLKSSRRRPTPDGPQPRRRRRVDLGRSEPGQERIPRADAG